MSALNDVLPRKTSDKSVSCSTRHRLIGAPSPLPQSTLCNLQLHAPEGDAARQLSTAVFKAVLLVNGDGPVQTEAGPAFNVVQSFLRYFSSHLVAPSNILLTLLVPPCGQPVIS